jgi:hypothetical protein
MNYANWKTETRSAGGLFLDPRNPRIPPSSKPLSETELIGELVLHDDVYDLAKNIAANGFFPSEPLVAIKEEHRLIVVEGNRRLAACKLLVSPEAAPKEFETKFRSLSEKFDQNSLKAIPVVIAPSRGSTVPLVIARHTSSQIERWVPAMQANFYYNLLHQGMSIDDVAKEFNQQVGKIREALHAHHLYQMACRLDLPMETANVVRNPRGFNLTTLERIFQTPAGREFFGVSLREDGVVVGTIDPNEFKKGFSRAVADVATGAVDSRLLNTPEDIQKYLTKFPPSERPDLSNKGSFDSTTFMKPGPPKSIPSGPKAVKKPVVSAMPVGLIPRTFECKLAVRRIQDLFTELKRLSPGKFPNACALALRCFLELSLYSFLNSKGEITKMRAEEEAAIAAKNAKRPPDKQIPPLPSDWMPSLDQMLNWIADATRNLIAQPHVTKALKKVMKDEQELFALNLYAHNPAYHPTEPRLRESWKKLEELFKAILS